jgi:hypothetical protein
MDLKPGMRLRSAVSAVEVVVVVAIDADFDLRCGGHAMVQRGEVTAVLDADPAFATDVAMGKRYTSADGGLEVMVTKGGPGALSLGAVLLQRKDTKPLPASD